MDKKSFCKNVFIKHFLILLENSQFLKSKDFIGIRLLFTQKNSGGCLKNIEGKRFI